MTGKTGATLNRGNSKTTYETPFDFIAAVEKRFGKIKVDLACEVETCKGSVCFTKEHDSFKFDWHKQNGLCWLNPPFNNIATWAEKCAEESKKGAKILFLVPASVGSNWFCNHVFPNARVYFLNNRLTFVGQKDPYPKDCILAHFGSPSGCEVWRWK